MTVEMTCECWICNIVSRLNWLTVINYSKIVVWIFVQFASIGTLDWDLLAPNFAVVRLLARGKLIAWKTRKETREGLVENKRGSSGGPEVERLRANCEQRAKDERSERDQLREKSLKRSFAVLTDRRGRVADFTTRKICSPRKSVSEAHSKWKPRGIRVSQTARPQNVQWNTDWVLCVF